MQNRRKDTVPSGRPSLSWCDARVFYLVAACAIFFVQSATAQQAPSQILNQYRAQRVTWMANVWPFANNLFFWLALIEFTWSAAIMMLEKTDLQSWTAALIRRIMWIGAFYALLLNGRTWIPTIVDSFNILGQQASGAGPMSPSDVFMRGLNVAGALIGWRQFICVSEKSRDLSCLCCSRCPDGPLLHRHYGSVRCGHG